MNSPRPLLGPALDAFGAKVHAVPAGAWSKSTPCTEWSVRDLVNHVVAEHLWVPHLLHGETIADVGERYDGDVLGADPVHAWDEAGAASSAAWQALPSDDVTVHLSFGDVPAGEYAEQMLADLVVHGWDLARGAGLDESFDPAAVEHVLAYVEPQAKLWRDAGIFGEPVEVDSADPGARLLGVTGRRP
ncbi:MAG TPA: TIGR03086 family metal-binding protein [Acidothermaceae bacterium]|jgi:uncharacterized protein (TIGR03086 family)|nr:TIGR03086 family metal-binding protein [Acidothermaceae bacterium]